MSARVRRNPVKVCALIEKHLFIGQSASGRNCTSDSAELHLRLGGVAPATRQSRTSDSAELHQRLKRQLDFREPCRSVENAERCAALWCFEWKNLTWPIGETQSPAFAGRLRACWEVSFRPDSIDSPTFNCRGLCPAVLGATASARPSSA